MSKIDLRTIPKVCHSVSGVKTIKLTDRTNVTFENGIPEIIDENLSYQITVRKSSARYTESSQDSPGGSYISQSLKFFVPKKRFDVDYIIDQLLDNRVHVIYTDHNSSGEILVNAKMNHKRDSGQRRSDSNGYSFDFKAKTRKKYRNLSGVGIDVPFGDDQNTGTGSGTVVDPGDPGSNVSPGYFVKINPVQLNYIPTEDLNVLNLNKFVTGSDGINYFIDHLGVGMKFNVFPPNHMQFDANDFVGNTITIPNIPLSNYKINLNGSQRTLTTGSVDKNTFIRSGDVFTFYKLTPLTILDFYF